MAPTQHAKSIAAGILSAGIYLIIFSFGAGIPFMLLPTLPLFMVGLSRPPLAVCIAAATAIVLTFAITGVAGAVFYAGFIALPVLLFAPAAVAPHPAGGHIRPIGDLLTDLAIYAALVYAAIIAWYAGHGGLQQQIAAYMKGGFADADPQMQETAGMLGNQLAFLILAASAWWWLLLLYAHAVVANGLLAARSHKLRASLALAAFSPPPWLLAVLTVSASFSLMAGGTWGFCAQTVLLIVLLPYFLLGLVAVQEKIRALPGRRVMLFILYFSTFALLWPALIIAAAGVWKQCRTLIHPTKP